MSEWLAEHAELIFATLGVLVSIIGLLVKWGLVQKERGDVLTESIEEFQQVLEMGIAAADTKPTSTQQIAEVASKTVKSVVARTTERASRSVQEAIDNGVRRIDAKKPRRPFLRALGGFLVNAALLR